METFSLDENRFIIPNCFTVKIDNKLPIVLKQTRTQMSAEGLEQLSSSIKDHGQQTPGIIFAFSEDQAERYLYSMNKLWHLSYELSEFDPVYIKEKNIFYYLFLVAGHRRLEATKLVNVKYTAQIFFGKSFKDAITAQYEENFHEEIPLYDLVNFVSFSWVASKEEDPKLTLKSFAKNIHKSPSWLSNALKFSELPLSIQDIVNEAELSKGINYSIMIEFAKLYSFSKKIEKPFEEKLLLAYINHCISNKYNTKKVKKFCDIKKQEISGQQLLFELVPEEEINNGILRTLKANVTSDLTKADIYLTAVGPIARRITENAKSKAEIVLVKGQQLGKILTSK